MEWADTFDKLLGTAATIWQNQQTLDAMEAQAELYMAIEQPQNTNPAPATAAPGSSDKLLYLIAGGVALIAVVLLIKGR
jgi:hypothetical protein